MGTTRKDHPLAARFAALFAGLDRARGQFRITSVKPGGKIDGEAKTITGGPTLGDWGEHLQGATGLGVIPIRGDNTCGWAALDVDIYDIAPDEIQRRSDALKLPITWCRTKSGGWHGYVFFREPLACSLVRGKLEEWAHGLGFGGCEVFPKQSQLAHDQDVGNWLNMPYFGNARWAWLDGREIGAEDFLQLADSRRCGETDLVGIVMAQDEMLEECPPCLEALAARGVPPGQRNEALFSFAVYSRLRYPEGWEDQLAEINRAYITPPLGHQELSGMIKSVKRKDYFYKCDSNPIQKYCNKELCKRRRYGVGLGEGDPPMLPSSLRKLCYEPPMWVMTVEGINMEVTTDVLLSQQKYIRLVVEKLNCFPPPAKPAVWRKHIEQLLGAVEEVEVPDDASDTGRFVFLLEEFLLRKKAQEREEVMLGKPWTEDGRTCFRGPDLIGFLENARFKVGPRAVYSWIRDMGGKHGFFNFGGRGVNVWWVPTPQIVAEKHRHKAAKVEDTEEF